MLQGQPLLSDWYNYQAKKMGDFIEPGTHRSTNIKVKIETL